MGMSASAHLFYGITISYDQVVKLLDRFKSELPPIDDEEEDDEYRDLYEEMDALGELKGFEFVYCGTEGVDREDAEYGIAVWSKTAYSFDGVTKIRMPNVSKLDDKWPEIAKALKLGRKKPSWLMYTEWS